LRPSSSVKILPVLDKQPDDVAYAYVAVFLPLQILHEHLALVVVRTEYCSTHFLDVIFVHVILLKSSLVGRQLRILPK
jgi:hypothetical protein